MSRILFGLTSALNLVLGPLAVGVIILVLYFWLIKPMVALVSLAAIVVIILVAIKFAFR